ncbi:hypothetical protein DTO045G8_871 [Paecilomyces variotii]|nr:hypothetical protein DTO045G8_871 [Paecilomyces variotii]
MRRSPKTRRLRLLSKGETSSGRPPGEYLEKSTLKALARNISGLELPPTLLQHTFEHAPKDELAADYVGISLSSLLRDATVESTKELEAEDPFDEDEEENDD